LNFKTASKRIIILIDSETLAINDSVHAGVAEVKSYIIKKIDIDYFEDKVI
jgi:restriction endonuclease Mrr